jgi:acyl carrier protein
LQAVSLSGDLETWLSREISPTVVWDYPTVEQLARYLSENHVNGNHAAKSDNGAD